MSRNGLPYGIPTRLPRTRSQWITTIVVALIALAVWWFQNRPASTGSDPTTSDRTTSASSGNHSGPDNSGEAGTDPVSGLHWIAVSQLPSEGGETLDLIDSNGPFPYSRDGIVFGNNEGILPDHQRGYFHEYTVPTPGEGDRGARRIVTGGPGEYYWSGDHYVSFERIAR
jgi:ribonuclease T1